MSNSNPVYIEGYALGTLGGNNLVDIDNTEIFDTNTGKTGAGITMADVLEYDKAPEELKKEFDDYLEDWFKKNNDSVIFPGNVPLTFWDWAKERNDE